MKIRHRQILEIDSFPASTDKRITQVVFDYKNGILVIEPKNLTQKCFLKIHGSLDTVILWEVFEGYIDRKKTFELKEIGANILYIHWFESLSGGIVKIYIEK